MLPTCRHDCTTIKIPLLQLRKKFELVSHAQVNFWVPRSFYVFIAPRKSCIALSLERNTQKQMLTCQKIIKRLLSRKLFQRKESNRPHLISEAETETCEREKHFHDQLTESSLIASFSPNLLLSIKIHLAQVYEHSVSYCWLNLTFNWWERQKRVRGIKSQAHNLSIVLDYSFARSEVKNILDESLDLRK